MKNPDAVNIGAFARTRVSKQCPLVPQSLEYSNAREPELLREYPIIAAHFFGLSNNSEDCR